MKSGNKQFGPQYPDSIEREYYRHLNQYANAYLKMLKDELKRVLPQLKGVAKEEQPRVDGQIRMDVDIPKAIDKMFEVINAGMSRRFTANNMNRIVQSMITKSSKYSKKEMAKMARTYSKEDFEVEPLLTDKGMSEYFQNVIDMNVSLIRSISEYQQPKLKQALIAMITKDARSQDIAKMLEKEFNVTKGRAKMIARDQVGKLNGALERHRQEQLGMSRYIWRTANDSRVRDDHARLEGKTFKWSKPPVVNRSTGERGNPKEDYNCRCWAEPVFDDII